MTNTHNNILLKRMFTSCCRIIMLLILLRFPIACTKLVEVKGPFTSINADNIYTNDATAIGTVTSIYAKMSANPLASGVLTSISLYAGLSSDELTLHSGVADQTYNAYYKNALNNQNTGFADQWLNIYPLIYITNAALEGLDKSNSLTPSVKTQLLGEARFIRAFCYYYLTSLYGGVPLAVTSDYNVNANLSRSTQSQVYAQIIDDLKVAKALLSNEYVDGTLIKKSAERVRPTKWAASALLSRVYLTNSEYINAEAEATLVINNTSTYSILLDLDKVFLKNSSESIWQLQPVIAGWNTNEARLFIIPSTGPSGVYPVYLSDTLLKSFEVGDMRLNFWTRSIFLSGTNYYYPYKYKNATLNNSITEYATVLRLAEVFLVRAEARAQQGKIVGAESAASDLNMIRKRAGLGDYAGGNNKLNILNSILHERRVELFTEWGHRWFDLKRTGKVDSVMSIMTPLKGGKWNTNWQFYPIRLDELLKLINVRQNEDY